MGCSVGLFIVAAMLAIGAAGFQILIPGVIRQAEAWAAGTPEASASVASFKSAYGAEASWARWLPVSGAELAGGSADASADWVSGRCDVRFDAKAAKANWDFGGGALVPEDFVALHELGHCVFYKSPRLPWRQAGYVGPLSDGMLDEVAALDAVLDMRSAPERANWFGIAHEAFADALATAHLRRLGVSEADLARVAQARGQAPFDEVHDVGMASREAAKSGFQSGAAGAMESARVATAKTVLAARGFHLIAALDRDGAVQVIARGWCSWAHGPGGQGFKKAGGNPWLGRVVPTGGAQAWSMPIPELVMPAWATARIESGAPPQGEEACMASAAEALRARYAGSMGGR